MNNLKELKRELSRLEDAEFLLQMKDYWSKSDYDLEDQYNIQIRNLKKQIEELEKEV